MINYLKGIYAVIVGYLLCDAVTTEVDRISKTYLNDDEG